MLQDNIALAAASQDNVNSGKDKIMYIYNVDQEPANITLYVYIKMTLQIII